jgi:hypothetical protein
MSEDPIGFFSDDTNLYRYVGNDPVNCVDWTGLEEQFDPSKFAKKYISPNLTKSSSEWGYYAKGCVGLSSVSIVKIPDTPPITNAHKFPIHRSDANFFFSYDEAREFYNEQRSKNKSPVLILYEDVGKIKTRKELNELKNNPQWRPIDISIPIIEYDYSILANIDISKGKQPSWIHASGGWSGINNPHGVVMVTPVVEKKPDSRCGIYIVIPQAGRLGLKYDLNFDIPKIEPKNLPQSMEIDNK